MVLTRVRLVSVVSYSLMIFCLNIFSTKVLAESPGTSASHRNFGLGILVGSPTVISGKLWLNSERALDFGLGFSEKSWTVLSDYLWHTRGLIDFKSAQAAQELYYYFGAGLGFKHTDHRDDRIYRNGRRDYLWIRVPAGLEWQPSKVPLGVFLEVALGALVVPETSFEGNAGIGIRYYF